MVPFGACSRCLGFETIRVMTDQEQFANKQRGQILWPQRLARLVNVLHGALPAWARQWVGVTLLRYLIVGMSSLILDVCLFLFFHQVLRIPLLVANCLSLSIVILYAFQLQKRFTFQVEGKTIRRFGFFVVQIGVAALLNNLLLYLFVTVCGWHPAIAKLVDTAIVFFWNYTFSRIVVFRSTPPTVSDP
jgi:putative flippase GtrA